MSSSLKQFAFYFSAQRCSHSRELVKELSMYSNLVNCMYFFNVDTAHFVNGNKVMLYVGVNETEIEMPSCIAYVPCLVVLPSASCELIYGKANILHFLQTTNLIPLKANTIDAMNTRAALQFKEPSGFEFGSGSGSSSGGVGSSFSDFGSAFAVDQPEAEKGALPQEQQQQMPSELISVETRKSGRISETEQASLLQRITTERERIMPSIQRQS